MSEFDKPLPNHERLRLGRLVFDGADRLQIANRRGLSADDVDDAWLFRLRHNCCVATVPVGSLPCLAIDPNASLADYIA